MKRVIILRKLTWHRDTHGGGHTTEEFTVLRDLTDKALQKKLDEMNEPYQTHLWEVVKDYHLTKKKELEAYAAYCVQCAGDQRCKDEVSKALGKTFFYDLLKAFEE